MASIKLPSGAFISKKSSVLDLMVSVSIRKNVSHKCRKRNDLNEIKPLRLEKSNIPKLPQKSLLTSA